MAVEKKKKGVSFDPTVNFVANGYRYLSKDDLVAWYRFEENNSTLNVIDSFENELSGSYVGSPTFSHSNPYGKHGFSMVTDNSLNQKALIPQNDLFNNDSFTYSAWVNLETAGLTQNILSMGASVGLRDFYLDVAEQLIIDLRFSGGTSSWKSDQSINEHVNRWTHVTVAYNSSSVDDPVFYINGESTGYDTNPTPIGILDDPDSGLAIAADPGSGFSLDGKIDDVCVWNKKLTHEDIRALYSASSGSYKINSGFLRNPTRTYLRDRDAQKTAYPGILRNSLNKTVTTSSFYDDTKTILFRGETEDDVSWPLLLTTSSNVSSLVDSPNISPDIETQGGSRKGVSDYFFDRDFFNIDSNNTIDPFEESRIYIDSSSFYISGTSKEVIEGFSSPLASKTQISFDINPTEETEVFWSTGTVGGAVTAQADNVGSGIAYFNWSLKKWEMIGIGVTGSAVDYVNTDPQTRSDAPLAFGNTHQSIFGISEVNQSLSGYPTTFSGFPFASQFNATGSQLLDMSQYISHPFLLEKITIEWSGTLGMVPALTVYDSTDGLHLQCNQFFLLNQFNDVNENVVLANKWVDIASLKVKVFDATFSNSKRKDLITYGRIMRHDYADPDDLPDKWRRELEVYDSTISNLVSIATTGSFLMERSLTTVSKYPTIAVSLMRDDISFAQTDYFVMESNGNRSGNTLVSGRNFIKSAIGGVSEGSGIPGVAAIQEKVSEKNEISPYIILPTDKLIFGFSNQHLPYWFESSGDVDETSENAILTEKHIATKNVSKMSPGLGKMTFYGSLIQNQKEFHEGLNQDLTSEGVHESLHFNNPILDQFDVENSYEYSGSYIDELYGGEMFTSKSGDFDSNTPESIFRGVRARFSEGTMGTTGSSQRFVGLVDEVERFYDTILPNPGEIYQHNGGTVLYIAGLLPKQYIILLSLGDIDTGALSGFDTFWPVSFPFEERYGGFVREIAKNVFYKHPTTETLKVSAIVLAGDGALHIARESTADGNGVELSKHQTLETLYKYFYGTGDANGYVTNDKGTVKRFATLGRVPSMKKHYFIPNITYSEILQRGWKYGVLNAVKEHSKAIFRRDRYGQFRDMLEQKKQSRFYFENKSEVAPEKTVGLQDSPITVRFVDFTNLTGSVDPITTDSSNLNVFATSSLPYFDGDGRNR